MTSLYSYNENFLQIATAQKATIRIYLNLFYINWSDVRPLIRRADSAIIKTIVIIIIIIIIPVKLICNSE